MGLIALALWLLRYDIAWRTVRQTGLPRFIAVSLLLGYAWLVVGGVLTLVFGDTPSGPYRDAMLHAIFLGFVFAMIFAHAPIIFPSILTVPITFRSAFYAPLVLLHLSLVLRIGSDLGSWESARQWGGLLNVMAVLLFFGMMVRSLDKRGFARTQGADKGPLRTSRLRLARLPIHFFTAAVTFFGLGVVIAPWVVSDLVDFFYHPWLLAVTHIFTLGWITSTMMGVMYRYVPALTKNPLRFPRLASVQFTLFVIGVAGMVAHFVIGIWPGLWSAAAVVVLSVFFFAANMVPCLAPVRSRGVAESGMLLSILLLLIAAVLGLLLGLDKTFNFLGGNLIANLAGHAHLAALGWVSLTICAVSYRMIPAFLLPEVQLPRGAMWQLYGLAAAVAGLAVALLSGSSGTSFWGVAIVLGLLSYVAVLVSLVHSRCMPIDWTVRHAMAGVLWLVVSAGLGLSLIMIDPGSALGNRIAGAYGTLGLLGWVTNFIVGMSYQLFPGFVAGVRTAAGWPPLTITELSLPRYRPFVFFSLNLGDLVLASGLLMAQVELARLGAGTIAVGGVVYVAVMLWTLRYAYRRSVPAAARNPLRVLPGDSVNL
jgi:cbb3-type cytochrome oxidase subunit 1